MPFQDILWLDYETRSPVDLKKHGVYRYAEHPETRIVVASWALNDEPVQSQLVLERWPGELLRMLDDKHLQIRAHNAAFDRLVSGAPSRTLTVSKRIEQWYCTAVQARAAGFPGGLDKLLRACNVPHRKDPRGQELIKRLSMPQADGRFCEDPALLAEFVAYGGHDVEVMRAVSKRLPALRDIDLAVYHANERINDRGIPIDLELCELAMQYAQVEADEAAVRLLTTVESLDPPPRRPIRTPRSPALREYVYDNLSPAGRKLMTVQRPLRGQRGKFKEGISLDERVREALESSNETFPEAVDELIGIAGSISTASTGKFGAMRDRTSKDGRLRGAFIMNGGIQTGRFSSTGAQLHNFPRSTHPEPDKVIEVMRRGEPLPGNAMSTLKSMLRPAIRAPQGSRILRADWNAIEARGLPWLVNSEDALRYLEAFKDPDRDIYVEQALVSGLGEARQPGKVVVLSLGYGGGEHALYRMAQAYKVDIEDRPAVVKAWRASNAWARNWWQDLDLMAHSATRGKGKPGKPRMAGRVELIHNGYALEMVLPSGRRMHYPDARIADDPEQRTSDVEYLKASWHPEAGATEWPRQKLWHGLLAENATQAVCADLLREALVRADQAGLEVIGHVHDELLLQDNTSDEGLTRDLERTMLEVPDWASGFPLAVEAKSGQRFAK